MSGNKISEMIKLCLNTDLQAVTIYTNFAKLSDDKELKMFWMMMSNEENKHVEFWQNLLSLAEQDLIPQIFEDFEKVKSELESLNKKVDILMQHDSNSLDISRMFLIAYRMEFYVLHPAFEKLFQYAGCTGLSKPNPEDNYEQHIKDFIVASRRFVTNSPEIELLGETLERLWLENRMLAKQGVFDNLTGILNRRGFFESMKPLSHLAFRNNLSVGILMIDIDNFKQINDSYGHIKGDKVLHSLANVFSDSKRTADIIGRYGGDEFIMYLSTIEPDALFEVAEKLRERVEKNKKEYGIPVTVSIGAASQMLKGDIDKEMFDLIDAADVCLYKAKKSGKNKVTV